MLLLLVKRLSNSVLIQWLDDEGTSGINTIYFPTAFSSTYYNITRIIPTGASSSNSNMTVAQICYERQKSYFKVYVGTVKTYSYGAFGY